MTHLELTTALLSIILLLSMNLGDQQIQKVYKGDTEVSKIYKGQTAVYENGPSFSHLV